MNSLLGHLFMHRSSKGDDEEAEEEEDPLERLEASAVDTTAVAVGIRTLSSIANELAGQSPAAKAAAAAAAKAVAAAKAAAAASSSSASAQLVSAPEDPELNAAVLNGSSALLQQKNGMLLRVGLFLVRLRKAVAAALAITDTTQSAAFEAARAVSSPRKSSNQLGLVYQDVTISACSLLAFGLFDNVKVSLCCSLLTHPYLVRLFGNNTILNFAPRIKAWDAVQALLLEASNVEGINDLDLDDVASARRLLMKRSVMSDVKAKLVEAAANQWEDWLEFSLFQVQ
jgi:hypothetical protein